MATTKSIAPTAVERKVEHNDNGTEQDNSAMAELGKVQQLRRKFGFWTLLGLTASMMCTWEAVLFANGTALLNGGPSTLIYGFLYAWLGSLATAASLAEMASIYPTSGGQYYWTAMLAPKSQRVFLSWFTGWIATLGWIANTAAGAYFAATMIQGIAAPVHDKSYEISRWQGTLLMFAVMLVIFPINIGGTKLLSLAEGAILVLHLAGFVVITVLLVDFGAQYGSSHEVWATFTNSAGWDGNGLAWLVGLISGVLPLIGFDGPCHFSEEALDSAMVVPRAMVGTVLLNGVLGLGMAITFSYCVTVDSWPYPTVYDFIAVFYSAVSIPGARGMTAIIIVLMLLATCGFLATASRQTWSFARDRGVPFSEFLAHVNKKVDLPVRAITVCTIAPCLIALINIGSSAALNAIVSLTEAGLFISYLIPICLITIKKIRGEPIRYGPWKMGGIGIVANLFSAVFLVIATFFSFFPPAIPVTLVSMNWSVVVFVGFVVIGLVWYAIIGRTQYDGPVLERPLTEMTERP